MCGRYCSDAHSIIASISSTVMRRLFFVSALPVFAIAIRRSPFNVIFTCLAGSFLSSITFSDIQNLKNVLIVPKRLATFCREGSGYV